MQGSTIYFSVPTPDGSLTYYRTNQKEEYRMKVVLIDDEKAMHLIMKRMLAKIENVEIVGSFQETETAFFFLMSHRVDMIFVDINMFSESGLDFAKRLREYVWKMKLVFVTSHKEYALSAFDVYPYDYIIKPVSLIRLQETIQRALSEEKGEVKGKGKSYSKKSLFPAEPLTKREIEILQMISLGMTNREIAENFELAEGTVKNHIFNIFSKLQVKNRVQAMSVAKEHKLIH
jgi:DNA-binding NarL/FixJ family response regulator